MPPRGRKYRTTDPEAGRLDTSGWSPAERAAYELEQKLSAPVAELGLPVRVVNMLEAHDIIFVRQLVGQTYETLSSVRNLGQRTIAEIGAALRRFGVSPPDWTRPRAARKPSPRSGRSAGGRKAAGGRS